ncbi:hypothetical protein Tsubulata_001506 [Turnera subulata]|uniref:Pectinesterase n=1 Tax=Turnera subulata TaxID=218843 RepID=A0A9Q0J048_9ROSI|nr:hypothetical protein Tsubulata_001506 [Turnera subulata]
MLFPWFLFLLIPHMMNSTPNRLAYAAKLRNYRKIQNYRTIVVDQSGHGHFYSIQKAVDSIPSYNNNWVIIDIKAGIYWEKVYIPAEKPYIILRGEGRKKTKIAWGDHSTTSQSPTFESSANNTIAKGITFWNTYNFPLGANRNPWVPAVAVKISGDQSAFHRCTFLGVQDTLWDDKGRHYFNHCTIVGSVDYIFGGGQSIYESCNLVTLDGGFITAQARDGPDDPSGFVFIGCNVTGVGPVYLGRAWRQYSRVLFYRSSFSNIIDPRGWNSWDFSGHEYDITYAEYGNYGPGADTSNRVYWEKKLSSQEVGQLASLSFINADQWLH